MNQEKNNGSEFRLRLETRALSKKNDAVQLRCNNQTQQNAEQGTYRISTTTPARRTLMSCHGDPGFAPADCA